MIGLLSSAVWETIVAALGLAMIYVALCPALAFWVMKISGGTKPISLPQI